MYTKEQTRKTNTYCLLKAVNIFVYMPSSFLIQHYPAGICWHNLIRDHKMLTKFSTDTELGMCLGWSSTAKKKTSLAGVD